jgi:molecular chaperone Hsp33
MIVEPIPDPVLRAHLKRMDQDTLDIWLLEGGLYRAAAVSGTIMINQMRANHRTGPVETMLLGHGYLAASVLGAGIKGKDRLALQIECSGPVGYLSVETAAEGWVRGYLQNNPLDLEEEPEDLDPSRFFGDGTLSVVRMPETARTPFIGRVQLKHGTIARDLAYYYAHSEQTPSAFNLSIEFDGDGRPVGAAAVFVQALPSSGARSEHDRQYDLGQSLDEKITGLPSLGALAARGRSMRDVFEAEFREHEPVHLATRSVHFACPCSKERFSRFLAALPVDQLEDILKNGPIPLKTTCHNCNSTYEFSKQELEYAYQMAR